MLQANLSQVNNVYFSIMNCLMDLATFSTEISLRHTILSLNPQK
jgi:hypothetical protein